MTTLPQQPTPTSSSNVISPTVLQPQHSIVMTNNTSTVTNGVPKCLLQPDNLLPSSSKTPNSETIASSTTVYPLPTPASNSSAVVSSQHNSTSYNNKSLVNVVNTSFPILPGPALSNPSSIAATKSTSPTNSGRKRKNVSPNSNTISPSNATKSMINSTTHPVLSLSSTGASAIIGTNIGAGNASNTQTSQTIVGLAGRAPGTVYPTAAAVSAVSSSYPQSGTAQKYQGGTASVPAPFHAAQHQQQQQQQQQHAGAVEEQKGQPKPQLTEKKLRRLEKNRLSARECRRRKREAAETMLHEINILEAENVQLRLQLQIGQEAETSVNEEQHKLTQEIDVLLQSGEASEAEIYSTLEEFKEKYADYGHSRRSSIEFHLRNVARLLMPTQTTSVVMHAISSSNNLASMMDINPSTATNTNNNNNNDPSHVAALPIPLQQGTQFVQPTASATTADGLLPIDNAMTASSKSADESSTLEQQQQQTGATTEMATEILTTATATAQQPAFDPKKLFLFLAKYLNVTTEQATALKDSRFVAQEMDSCLDEAFNVLSELRDRLTKTGNDLETEFNNVRSILTPTQAAKFLVWVANNAACMHMLNELWERVYPST